MSAPITTYDLPKEMWAHVTSTLSLSDLMTMRCVAKFFEAFLNKYLLSIQTLLSEDFLNAPWRYPIEKSPVFIPEDAQQERLFSFSAGNFLTYMMLEPDNSYTLFIHDLKYEKPLCTSPFIIHTLPCYNLQEIKDTTYLYINTTEGIDLYTLGNNQLTLVQQYACERPFSTLLTLYEDSLCLATTTADFITRKWHLRIWSSLGTVTRSLALDSRNVDDTAIVWNLSKNHGISDPHVVICATDGLDWEQHVGFLTASDSPDNSLRCPLKLVDKGSPLKARSLGSISFTYEGREIQAHLSSHTFNDVIRFTETSTTHDIPISRSSQLSRPYHSQGKFYFFLQPDGRRNHNYSVVMLDLSAIFTRSTKWELKLTNPEVKGPCTLGERNGFPCFLFRDQNRQICYLTPHLMDPRLLRDSGNPYLIRLATLVAALALHLLGRYVLSLRPLMHFSKQNALAFLATAALCHKVISYYSAKGLPGKLHRF